MTSNVLKVEPEEMTIKSDVKRDDRVELAGHLSEALANTYLLYVKTQGVHWNVVGPLFYSVHKLTEEQYTDFAEAIDDIAERIRAIGFTAPGSFHQFSQITSIKEETGTSSTEEMLKQLIEGNEICSKQLRHAVLEAEKVNDVKTADLLTDRIGQHEENAWMLRATITE